jgi:hypothetical protein
VVDRVVDDVRERRFVLVLGFDQFRPEPAAEDVVAATVSVIERPRVLAVEVAHAVGEIRQRRFDDQVVVVAHQATGVQLPLIAAHDPAQDANERVPVGVVEDDRRMVVPRGRDVVVGAGGERTTFATHCCRR